MSQVQVTLTFASLELATAFFAKADSNANAAPAAVVSTDTKAPPKSAPTPPTKSADAKPSADKKEPAKEKPAAQSTQPTESDAPTLQTVSDAINAALKPGPQNRPKVVAVLAEFKTADGTPVTNAKALRPEDYAEFLLKLRITMDPGAAATEDLT